MPKALHRHFTLSENNKGKGRENRNDYAEVTWGGRLFQMREPATENAWSPYVDSYFTNFKTCTCWNPIMTILALLTKRNQTTEVCFVFNICNAFNAKPTVEFSTSRSILYMNTTHPPDHHSFRSLQSCHISTFIGQVSFAYPITLWMQNGFHKFLFHFERSSSWC